MPRFLDVTNPPLARSALSAARAEHVDVRDFGADTTGATDASSDIQDAYDFAASSGASRLVIPAGTYKLSTGLVFNVEDNVEVVWRKNSVAMPDSGVTAVTWQQQTITPTVLTPRMRGYKVDGGQTTDSVGPTSTTNTTGLLIKNCALGWFPELWVRNCTVGVKMLSAENDTGTPLWCEHNRLSGDISGCQTGIAIVTTDGTGSFAGTDWSHLNIDRCTTGVSVDSGSSIYRSRWHNVQMWLRQNQVGWDLSGNLKGVQVVCAFEAITGTGQVGIHLQSSAQNAATSGWAITWTGFYSGTQTQVTNDTSTDNLVWREGIGDVNLDTTEKSVQSRWRVRRAGNSRGHIEAATNFVGGGGWHFGNGTLTPDTTLYRDSGGGLRTDNTLRVGSSATASRPTPGGASAMWWDTDLDEPIWYNGSAWVRAAELVGGRHITFVGHGTALTWSSMPAALTEFRGVVIYRFKTDLSKAARSRLQVNVSGAGHTGATLKAQYSTDQSSWYDLTASASIDSGPSLQVSAWAAIPAGAADDVYVRLVGVGGNGSTTPSFGLIALDVE